MAPQRKKVSEKSLELNVGVELLQCVRSFPNCEKALWFGLTQAQESRMGLDEFVLNVPRDLLLMLQFKSPRPASSVIAPYIFDINLRQNQTLLSLATRFAQNVHYVFPLYREWGKARQDAPDLAQDTWLMPVSLMPPSLRKIQPSSPYSSGRVEVEVVGSNIAVRYNSDEVVCKACSVKQYCSRSSPVAIPPSALEEWIQETGQDQINQGVHRRPVRGLCAVVLP